MPILSSIAGAAAKAYGLMSSALRLITDNFNRANGSLGTTNTGQTWSATRGSWSISSNQATSSDSASTYPMATVDINAQNVVVSADITDGGPGLAFWVTDANSWWASSVNYRNVYTSSGYYSGTTYPGTVAYYSGSLVATGCEYGCFTGISCVDCDTLQPNGSPLIYSCTGPGGNGSSGGGNCGTYFPPTSGGCGPISGTANCNFIDTSYYTYYTELKLYKNVSGTISTVATQQLNSNTSGYSEVNSVKVQTSNDSITVSGYSNTGLTSQLGSSLTNTPSSPTKGTKAGIIKTPSEANSGSLLDNFSVQNVL
jgi:hypothetical protein